MKPALYSARLSTPMARRKLSALKEADHMREVVLLERIELSASPLPRVRSTTELQQLTKGPV